MEIIKPPKFKDWPRVKKDLGLDDNNGVLPNPRDMSFKATRGPTAKTDSSTTIELFVSEDEVSGHNLEASIPKGYRMATMKEVAFVWRYHAAFIAYVISNKARIWTHNVNISGHYILFHEILEDGGLKPVTTEDYNEISHVGRAVVRSGRLRVTASGTIEALEFDARWSPDYTFHIAYVKDTDN